MILQCAGMIRSGSTLQYNLAKEVVEVTHSGGYLHANMDLFKEVKAKAPLEEWWVNKGHIYNPELHDPIVEAGQMRVVMIYRDLRDVVVSTMHFRNRTFEDVVSSIREEAVEAEREWLENVPHEFIHRARYETVIHDAASEIQAIADLVGVNLSLRDKRQIASRHSLPAVRQMTSKFENWDAHTRYGPKHIRSGSSGVWKQELTPKQIARIEQEVGHWLVENDYRPQYSGG